MTHPPAGPSTPPPPPGPKHDLMHLAASLGFQDLGHAPQGVRPLVADSEGRAGFPPVPGAVPFTLPKPLGLPRFGAGPQDPPDPKPVPNPHPYPPPHAA